MKLLKWRQFLKILRPFFSQDSLDFQLQTENAFPHNKVNLRQFFKMAEIYAKMPNISLFTPTKGQNAPNTFKSYRSDAVSSKR